MSNRTFAIIKPDAVKNGHTGKIYDRIISSGFKILCAKLIHMTLSEAKSFYEIHKDRPFFNDLVNYMISGPVIVQVFEGINAIHINRTIMGATNPDEAEEGTVRKEFAISIEANSVHGSDSLENAEKEINYFFADYELIRN